MTHDVTWITEKELEREIENTGDEFCWKNNMNILYRRWENEKCQRSEKKNHQGKKWAALKKANSNTSNKIFGEHRRHIFFITSVTRKSDVVVVENNGKEMYKKSGLRLQSFFLLLFGLLTFLQFSLPSLTIMLSSISWQYPPFEFWYISLVIQLL